MLATCEKDMERLPRREVEGDATKESARERTGDPATATAELQQSLYKS